MASHSLVCPFLTDDPMFARGVEFGMLYARMRDGEPIIEDYFCRENQDRILLLASRLGWRVNSIKRWKRDWFWLSMEKEPSPVT